AGREIKLTPSPANLPLFAFILVALLSFGMGQLPWFMSAQPAPLRAQLGELAVFVLSAGAFLLVGNQVKNLRWLKRMTWTFLALGGLLVAGRSVPGLNSLIGLLFRSFSAGSLFWTWLVAMAFSQALLNQQLSRSWRLVLSAVVAGAMYIGLVQASAWSSGWLPSVITIGVILWLAKPRLRVLLALVSIAVVALFSQRLFGFVMEGDNEYSLITRTAAWEIIGQLVLVNPILGLGPANYYWYTPLIPIMGWRVVFNSHNNYVDIIAQTGLLGMACFLWFMWRIGRHGWQLRNQVPEGFARAYIYGALGGLAGTLVAGMLGDWVLPFVYNIGLTGLRASIIGWLFLGGIVTISQLTHATHSTPQAE
ncbi:MAG: O-antigen ligase family protein, partial [Chloroflexi bacterium]|nr:O-antigen ligase family protein [Chloroflexota bacterium]